MSRTNERRRFTIVVVFNMLREQKQFKVVYCLNMHASHTNKYNAFDQISIYLLRNPATDSTQYVNIHMDFVYLIQIKPIASTLVSIFYFNYT